MPGMKVLRVETLDGIKFFLENPECAGKKCCGDVAAAARFGNGAAAAGVLRELFGGVGGEGAGGGAGVCAAGERGLSETVRVDDEGHCCSIWMGC